MIYQRCNYDFNLQSVYNYLTFPLSEYKRRRPPAIILFFQHLVARWDNRVQLIFTGSCLLAVVPREFISFLELLSTSSSRVVVVPARKLYDQIDLIPGKISQKAEHGGVGQQVNPNLITNSVTIWSKSRNRDPFNRVTRILHNPLSRENTCQ